MSYLLDPDPVQTVQETKRANSSASQPTDLQKSLPLEPRQDSQNVVAIQAADPTQLSQSLSLLHQLPQLPQYGRSRSQSIDQPRATLFPPSQRAEVTRSARDVKYSHSGFPRFNFLRRSGPKNPSIEKGGQRAIGGSKTYSDGTEESARIIPNIRETYTKNSGRSDSPKLSLHNPTDGAIIPVQNENPVSTIAIGTSSEATAPKFIQPRTGNHSDLEKQLITISQQHDKEVEKKKRLMEEKDELKRENWRLHEENNRLREENEAIKSAKPNGVPAEIHENLANQYKDLKRQCDNLVRENQQLRLDLKLESEKEIMATFQTLCCDLTNACCRYAHGSEVAEMQPKTVCDIEDLLQIRSKISRIYLSSPDFRLALSMACLSQLLVETIFHDPDIDISGKQSKDLWANSAMAGSMASLEKYMYSDVLNIAEYHRWRCMTVRFLSRSRKASDAHDRAEPVLRIFLKLYGEMFQLGEEHLGGLESELRSVIIKAVELSLCLRKQRSLIVVRTFEAFDDYHKPSDDSRCLVIRPELVRLTSPHGEETGERSVLVGIETQEFRTESAAQSSGGGRRRKGSSIPFSKKARKAKSAV